MASNFFFYDLETSGFSASAARIMQFAGQRTDAELKPVGEPVDMLIKLAPDVLPDPEAIMITGITPQATISDGLTEAEFLKYFYEYVVQPDTIFVGYNSVRFDDEFMRYLHYRNFYDPYEWHWANGCSRWDLLDAVRMTRALRPDGINWPFTPEGRPVNRLELLTTSNGLQHDHAHDALSDVMATIAVARLIHDKQPDLFGYLLAHRGKKSVAELITSGQPFVYTSGRYPSDDLHTTVAALLSKHPQQDHGLVYDLRYDPTDYLAMTPAELADAWRFKKDRGPDDRRLPVKTLKYNRCPAVAPLGVIKEEFSQQRLNLKLSDIMDHFELLKANRQTLAENVLAAQQILDAERQRTDPPQISDSTVDGMLYDGFVGDQDKQTMSALRAADPQDINELAAKFKDHRLQQLAPLYKARNYPGQLSADERQQWEAHIARQLFEGGAGSRLASYFGRLQKLAAGELTSQQEYALEELQLYGEAVMPSDIGQ